MLNKETFAKLTEQYQTDLEALEFLQSCIESFEKYHSAVFAEQTFLLLYGGGALDADEYRDRRTALDKARTVHHNSIISNVGILNRMAEQAGLPPVYDGIVSMDKPYRREVANAVFAFIEDVINSRT